MAHEQVNRPESRIDAIIEHDGKQYHGRVVHLGFTGALLHTDAQAGLGDTVELDFEMLTGEHDLWVHTGGQVVGREERLLRVEFWEMDLESLADLRWIISAIGADGDQGEGQYRPVKEQRARHSRDGRVQR